MKKFHDPFAGTNVTDDHVEHRLQRKKTFVADAPDRLFVALEL